MEIWQLKIEQLLKDNFSLRIEKQNRLLFESAETMLKALFHCVKEQPVMMKNATVIDKVTGLAAAYLCIVGEVKEIYTVLASDKAIQKLAQHKIVIKARQTVPQILNKDKSAPCPMEQMAYSCGSAAEFLDKLAQRIEAQQKVI
jgi:hypothetical protein